MNTKIFIVFAAVTMLVAACVQDFKVAEVPVTWRNVLDGRVRAIHNLEVLRDILKIRYRMAMGEFGYSRRSASIGSSRAARFAG